MKLFSFKALNLNLKYDGLEIFILSRRTLEGLSPGNRIFCLLRILEDLGVYLSSP